MEINVQELKRCHLVIVSGRIDSYTAPDLEIKLLDLIAAGQRNIAVNMKGVSFISSAGLKALLSATMRVKKKVPAGIVAISAAPPEIKNEFHRVGFDRGGPSPLFEFYDNDISAVGNF